jgi:site-specific recombinase XerD
MELERAVEEFLTYLQVELNRSPATRKGYAKDLRIFLKYLESRGQGNICIEQITREHLSDYLRHLTKDRGLRPNTVKRRLTALKPFFGFLVDCEYLEQNPASSLPRPRLPRKHPRYLLKEEVEKLIETFPEDGSPTVLRDKTALICLFYTGVGRTSWST